MIRKSYYRVEIQVLKMSHMMVFRISLNFHLSSLPVTGRDLTTLPPVCQTVYLSENI